MRILIHTYYNICISRGKPTYFSVNISRSFLTFVSVRSNLPFSSSKVFLSVNY